MSYKTDGLSTELNRYFESLSNKRGADPDSIAGRIYNYFNQHGQFFYDRFDKVYLLYQDKLYAISTNRDFIVLITKSTGISFSRKLIRAIGEFLACLAYIEGKQVELASWMYTDQKSNTIYVNLNSPKNTILKISKESIEEIPNGLNDDGVLLEPSDRMLPFNFLPDCDIKEGMNIMKELVFDNLACDREQRYLILCWMISAFMLDFVPHMGLMKFSGPTSSGKTTAARFLSLLIYGDDPLGDTSAAAAYALASQNPLLIIDNLESVNLTKSIFRFLLLSATKGCKEKRTAGTESGITQERPKALVLITAIEPFVKAELTIRTYNIEFSSKYKRNSFIDYKIARELIKKRDLILSSILKLIQKKILPNLARQKDFITILKKEHKNHSRNRTEESLAMLMLILDKLLEYIPYCSDTHLPEHLPAATKISNAWIKDRNIDSPPDESETEQVSGL